MNTATTKPAPKKLAKIGTAPAYQPEIKMAFMVGGSEPTPYVVTHGTYAGTPYPHGWSCTCMDFHYRHAEKGSHCKHIKAVLDKLPGAIVTGMLSLHGAPAVTAGYAAEEAAKATPAPTPASEPADAPAEALETATAAE